MRLSGTLSLYIGRNYLYSFLAFFFGILALILLLDSIELLRRAASKPDVGFAMVLEMALLRLPHFGQQLFPFAALFGGMAAFWRLTRSNELAITRAAGISAWQFLLPSLTLSVLLGVFVITVFNPLASTTLSRFKEMEAVHLKGQKSLLALSGTGLWLRQGTPQGQTVLHANSVLYKDSTVDLGDVTVFLYTGQDTFSGRIDAASASLGEGFWHMRDAWINTGPAPVFQAEFWMDTDLTLSKIQDSLAPPETMSFWDLPDFIKTLEDAGFSAVRHRLHWQSLMATPVLMCAMILIAATVSLRHTRRSGTLYVVVAGVVTGFMLYFISYVMLALGNSESIPVTLAAWTPSGVALMLGVAMLLHLEDG